MVFWAPRTGSIFSGNTFRQNIINGSGGGLYLEYLSNNIGSGTVMVENNYFNDNSATTGGGFTTKNNPAVLQNNVFSGNSADQSGGALFLWNSTTPSTDHFAGLINNSFNGNTATNNGGAIYSLMAKPLIFNSIFWNDSANNGQEIYLTSINDTVEIGFSNINLNAIQGGFTFDGSSNINEDPLFTNLELLTISGNSPCVNSGIEEYTCHYGDLHIAPAYDIASNPRPLNEDFDMGAYERIHGQIIHVPG